MPVPLAHEGGGSDSESDDDGDGDPEFVSRSRATDERLSKTPESSVAWEKLMQPNKSQAPDSNIWLSSSMEGLRMSGGGSAQTPSPPDSSASSFRTLSLPNPVLSDGPRS